MTCITGIFYCGVPPYGLADPSRITPCVFRVEKCPYDPLYPSMPQRPPKQPEEKPPQAVIYQPWLSLRFPSAIAFDMDVYYHEQDRVKKILPTSKSEPIWLMWKHFPNENACPQVQSVTTNPYVNTELRKIKYGEPCHYGGIGGTEDVLALPAFLTVLQLAFINQRWILAVHEVEISFPGYYPTEEDLKNVYNNRKERLVNFYDSQLSGLDTVHGGRNILVSLHVSRADILLSGNGISDPLYTVQPTSSSAYAMFTFSYRTGTI